MLNSTKIQRAQSERRQKLAELSAIENPSEDEVRSMNALDLEYRNGETQLRAALIGESEERNSAREELEGRSEREFSDLIGRFELRQVAFAIDEGRALTGATKEVVEELRSAGGYQGIPVPYAALETRAGETVAEDQVSPKTIRPTVDRLFPASLAARLGIERIQIDRGEVAFPVATAGAVFGWQTTELGNVGGPNPYDTAERSLTPDNTGGAQMVISRKAMKQAGEGLEAAIRRDLNAVIGAELDRVVVNGTGTNGQPLGIIPGASNYGIASTDIDAAASWAAFRTEIVAFMEANAITSPGAVNLGLTPAIWADLDDALISGTAVSQWNRLTAQVGTPAISNVIPDATAILTATVQGIAPGYLGLYGGIDLIRDPYTKAASGQLVLTALVTADFVVPRGMQVRILADLAEPATP